MFMNSLQCLSATQQRKCEKHLQ